MTHHNVLYNLLHYCPAHLSSNFFSYFHLSFFLSGCQFGLNTFPVYHAVSLSVFLLCHVIETSNFQRTLGVRIFGHCWHCFLTHCSRIVVDDSELWNLIFSRLLFTNCQKCSSVTQRNVDKLIKLDSFSVLKFFVYLWVDMWVTIVYNFSVRKMRKKHLLTIVELLFDFCCFDDNYENYLDRFNVVIAFFSMYFHQKVSDVNNETRNET